VMSYMVGRRVEEAAVELKMDPAELRRKNLVRKTQFPYKTMAGFTYDVGDFEGVLADAVRESDWAGFAARRADAKARGRLRGRGVATHPEASGGGVGAPRHAEGG